MTTIGILGGGLSAISLQHLLSHPNEILEKEDRVGGLCRSFTKDGFTYDVGGHILFSKDEPVMEFVKDILGANIRRCRRENKILYKNRFVKYPFENGLSALDKDDIYDCLIGFLRNPYPPPTDFEGWIYHRFGKGIAEKYLIPYNRKIWKTPLTQMGLEWVERVPKPPLEDIVKSAVGIETEGYLHQLYFLYPQSGGIEALIQSLLKPQSSIQTAFPIRHIQKKGDGWLISDGSRERIYPKIVSTLPIKEAVSLFENVPPQVKSAAEGLRHNAVRVMMIGVNNESLLDKSAVYLPSPDIWAHRICYMGFFSPQNVPPGKSSLIAEITTHQDHELYHVSGDVLLERTADQLHAVGVINKKDIIATDIKDFEYGYVVYDLEYKKNLAVVKGYFESLGIILHGRFAEYEYINMDEVIKRSMRLADRLNGEYLSQA